MSEEDDFEGDSFWDKNGLVLCGQEIFPELLTEIFFRVSDKDLILNCTRVCKTWKRIIDGHQVWKLKAKARGCHIPKRLNSLPKLPKHVFRNIATRNPFGRNLIKNPYGKDKMKHWDVRSSGGDGWGVESQPKGANKLDTVDELRETGFTSCFATSYSLCEKLQRIDLLKEVGHKEVLQVLKPNLYICEWFAGRFDCACRYMLRVEVKDGSGKAVCEQFKAQHDVAQWVGSEWTKVEHTFENVENAELVTFIHSGKDLQFWKGRYGPKMTGATVKLILP